MLLRSHCLFLVLSFNTSICLAVSYRDFLISPTYDFTLSSYTTTYMSPFSSFCGFYPFAIKKHTLFPCFLRIPRRPSHSHTVPIILCQRVHAHLPTTVSTFDGWYLNGMYESSIVSSKECQF